MVKNKLRSDIYLKFVLMNNSNILKIYNSIYMTKVSDKFFVLVLELFKHLITKNIHVLFFTYYKTFKLLI